MSGFLSSAQVSQWRVLSHIDGWGITSPFGEKSRKLLLKLVPPFIPEDEPLVFDCGIYSGWGGPQLRVTQINYKNVTLRDGFFFATDFRLIFGHKDKGIVYQIPYEGIKAIYSEKDDYTLVLNDGTQVSIRTKIPRPSLLGALAVLGGSPMDRATISRMEQNKAEIAENFTSLFAGFFTEIVDENRSRRQS